MDGGALSLDSTSITNSWEAKLPNLLSVSRHFLSLRPQQLNIYGCPYHTHSQTGQLGSADGFFFHSLHIPKSILTHTHPQRTKYMLLAKRPFARNMLCEIINGSSVPGLIPFMLDSNIEHPLQNPAFWSDFESPITITTIIINTDQQVGWSILGLTVLPYYP